MSLAKRLQMQPGQKLRRVRAPKGFAVDAPLAGQLDTDLNRDSLAALLIARGARPVRQVALDVEAALARIPPGATMTGMFVSAVADLMRSRGLRSEVARGRYVGFQRYPLDEHCRLLVEAGRKVFPDMPPREALRRIGRGAPATLLGPAQVVVRMSAIYNLLDCHNVGVFEGVLKHAGVRGRVRLHAVSPTQADLLCEWGRE